jgi:hypothetical protein
MINSGGQTPQEIVTEFLPRIIPDRLADAIRAVLAEATPLAATVMRARNAADSALQYSKALVVDRDKLKMETIELNRSLIAAQRRENAAKEEIARLKAELATRPEPKTVTLLLEGDNGWEKTVTFPLPPGVTTPPEYYYDPPGLVLGSQVQYRRTNRFTTDGKLVYMVW